jgi:hypothetical protein
VDKPCIWVAVYERAKAARRLDDLRVYIPPPNPALRGTSSWINYFLGRDSRPGNPPPLVSIRPAPGSGIRWTEGPRPSADPRPRPEGSGSEGGPAPSDEPVVKMEGGRK